MFTGIVQATAKIVSITAKQDFQTHVLELPEQLSHNINIGASIAHNGCCLTVTKIEGLQVQFDLMKATLDLTNLGELEVGDAVNVERAARFGDEIGGHNMSGHISGTVVITKIERTANNQSIWFEADENSMRYILKKGYIGLDGCSLTIAEVKDNQFSVNLIPETLTRTLFGQRQIGDRVNLEVDPQTQAIVDTVERVLATKAL
ncbi:riboflavin synthase subunit alpha [Vibrio sp. UCD-FRSSP16_10]|uniref:riboflavin synthase n=1 Tax=unclassified Vibrio TaxID=2614977 RepID=UPI0007FCA6FB|nr:MULTISPECIES: riboflavin synthase [unclassified Vibrio]OBT12163.1 riboflavin synthase subunit alpha [Vibrio sp. UCD-FRSSP16_30]OBT20494.1 riboflavin synthase subunit alpha [Vibrio sp. UCD-FRSSP16_10]